MLSTSKLVQSAVKGVGLFCNSNNYFKLLCYILPFSSTHYSNIKIYFFSCGLNYNLYCKLVLISLITLRGYESSLKICGCKLTDLGLSYIYKAPGLL